MRIAQQLYEGVDIKGQGTVGLITYLRTDSTRISEEADVAAREYISEHYGENYTAANAEKKKNTGKIVPIYPLTYNLSEYTIRQAIENALNMVNHKLEETLPSYIINDYKLDGINNAMQQIHFSYRFYSM